MALLLAVALTGGMAGSAWATDYYKTDNTTVLNTNTSWRTAPPPGGTTPAGPPASGADRAFWEGTYAADRSANIGAAVTWDSIVVNSCPARTVMTIGATGGTLTLNNGIDMSAADVNFTVGCPLALGNSQTWRVNSGRTLRLAGVTGAYTITMTGGGNVTQSAAWNTAGLALDSTYSGTVTLSAVNTFTNNIQLNSATAKLVSTVGNGFGTSGQIEFGTSGASIEMRADVLTAFTKGINSTSSGGTIVFGRTTTGAAVVHLLTQANSLGGNTITVTPNNFTADIPVELKLTGTNTLSGNPTFAINGNGAGTNTLTFSGGFDTQGATRTLTFNGATSAVKLSGAFSGMDGILDLTGTTPVITVGTLTTTTNAVRISGSGIYILNGNSTFAGGVILNNAAATVIATAAGGFGATSGKVKFNVAGTGFELRNDTGYSFTTGLDTTRFGGTITVNRATAAATATTHTLTLASMLGSNTVTVQAGGNITSGTAYGLTLSGASTLSGDAVFQISNNGAGIGTLILPALSGSSSSLTFTGSGNVAQVSLPTSGVWSHGGGLTLDAGYTGTVTLKQANTYTGNTTVSAGTLKCGLASALPGGSGKGNVSVAATLDINGYAQTINGLSGAGTINNSSATPKALSVGNNDQTSQFDGTLQNTGAAAGLALTKAGAGTLTLSGAATNTFGGLTTVSGGTLLLDKSGAAQAIGAGGLTISAGTLVKYTGTSSDMMGTGAVSIVGTGQLDFNGASDTIGDVTIAATGAAADTTPILNTAGGGTLTIGTLAITPQAGFTSRINTGTGTLRLGGPVTFTAATTGQAQISGNVDIGSATRTLTVNHDTATPYDLLIDANMSSSLGAYGLTLDGTGTVWMTGNNRFTGTLTLLAGTLKLGTGGSLASTNIVVGGPGAILNLTSKDVLPDMARLTVTDNGAVRLDAGVEEEIGSLAINGVEQAVNKTYGSSASGADVQDDAHFSGTGLLVVGTKATGSLLMIR